MTESFFGLSRWPSFHAVFVNNRVLVQKGNVNCLQLPAFTFNDHSVSSQEATCKAELGENKKRGSGQELPGSQILLVRYCRGFGCFLLVNSLNQFEPYILFIIINRLSSVKCSVVSNTTKKKNVYVHRESMGIRKHSPTFLQTTWITVEFWAVHVKQETS